MRYKRQRSISYITGSLIILVAITAAYMPGVSGQFIMDDHPLVKENSYIKEVRPFCSYFLQEDGVTGGARAGGYHTGYYRPLVNITYFLDYKIWGMNAPGFRATNLALHLVTCLLLFHVLSGYCRGLIVPLAAALLFGLHPVNTEAVSWVSSRNNILVSMFSLASFYFFCLQGEKKGLVYPLLSLLFFGLALLSKEFAAMLICIFFLYKRFRVDRIEGWRMEFRQYLPYVGVLLCYFWMRWLAIGSMLSPAGPGNMLQRILHAPYLIVYNLRLVFFPWDLHLFKIGYPDALLSPETVLGWAGLVLTGALLWRYRKERIVLFSVLAFITGLFPVLNIIQTSADSLISSRWLYFPMMFLALSLCWFLDRMFKLSRTLAVAATAVLIIFLGTYTFLLNRDHWHDEWSLFHREVVKYGSLAYTGGLAELYHQKNDYAAANRYYIIAIRAFPYDPINRIDYAALLLDLKESEKALFHLKKAEKMKMTSKVRADLCNNKGMAYFNLGRLDKAIPLIQKAVWLAPHTVEFWENMGAAYGHAGDYERSISVLKKGRDIAGDSVGLSRNLAISHMRLGDYGEAISVLEKISGREMAQQGNIAGLLKRARQKEALSNAK